VSDRQRNRWAHLEDPTGWHRNALEQGIDPAEYSEPDPWQPLIDEYAERGAVFPMWDVRRALQGTLDGGRPVDVRGVPVETMLEWLRDHPEKVRPFDPLEGHNIEDATLLRKLQEPAPPGPPTRVTTDLHGHRVPWTLDDANQIYFTLVTSTEADWVRVLLRGTPKKIQKRINRAEKVLDELHELQQSPKWDRRWGSDWSTGVETLLRHLRSEKDRAVEARAMLAWKEWTVAKDSKVQAAMPPDGYANRPRAWLNETICRLYEAIRSSYDAAWPEHRKTKAPQRLREHIAFILRTAGFDGPEVDPRPHGKMETTLHNHFRKKEAAQS